MNSLMMLSVPVLAFGVFAAVEAGNVALENDAMNATPQRQVWTARSGTTTVRFDNEALAERGLSALTRSRPKAETAVVIRRMAIRRSSTLTFSVINGSLAELPVGRLVHVGDVGIVTPSGEFVLHDMAITPPRGGGVGAPWSASARDGEAWLTLNRVKAGFDAVSSELTVVSPEVRISRALAKELGDPTLADLIVGSVTIHAHANWAGGDRPESDSDPDHALDTHAAHEDAPDGVAAAEVGGDMTFCQLFGFQHLNSARLGDICGMTVGTTSWNIGTMDIMWFPIPDEEHPFIVMNAYRLMNDRFEQIGMSSIKHGFYALGSHQCGGPPCTHEPGHAPGDWLGTGCTDTYSSFLNGVQSGMGPRYEVNPWTGHWYYPDSHMASGHSHDAIQHRIQIHDTDLNPAMNPGATYYGEGYYAILDDIDVMNSAAWKPFTVDGLAGGAQWVLGMSGIGYFPNIGFAIDAWPGATKTIVAQEVPVQEFLSPDGRCVLAAKATELPGEDGWHYEYAMLNIDMDRQVGSFSVPIPPGTVVTNVGFYAVEHHGEPFNTVDEDAVAIDNAPWTPLVTADAVSWSTDTNPILWGTMYNFRFDANVPPATVTATVGHFRPGTPEELAAETVGPGPALACPTDIDGTGDVGFADLLLVLHNWGVCLPDCPPDVDGDGEVGIQDLVLVLFDWGPCP